MMRSLRTFGAALTLAALLLAILASSALAVTWPSATVTWTSDATVVATAPSGEAFFRASGAIQTPYTYAPVLAVYDLDTGTKACDAKIGRDAPTTYRWACTVVLPVGVHHLRATLGYGYSGSTDFTVTVTP